MKYNAQKPSETYSIADYNALMRSNIPEGLVGTTRFDSAEDASVFFARELDYIKAKSYDKVYPEFTALAHFPITHEVPAGAETTTYYSYDKTGMAKIISNYATDLPRADVKGEPSTAYIKSVGDSYGYSMQEMRASHLAGKSLDTRKAEAARYQIERKMNQIAWAGDADAKLVGVLSTGNNIPIVSPATVVVDGANKTEWEYKSADEILTDVNNIWAYQSQVTMDVEHADKLMIPPKQYLDISTRRIPTTGITVKKFLLDNSPYLKEIISAAELSAAATDTNPFAADTAFAFTDDEEKFSVEIPMEFYQYPLQAKGLEIEIPCEARIAGAIMYYPMANVICSGI